MTLSIAAIAGPTATPVPRATASNGIFALSLAQMAGALPAAADADPPSIADPKSKEGDDSRQDDAADGNALPLATPVAPDASLFAALLPPPGQAPIPAAPDTVAKATPTARAAATTVIGSVVAPVSLPAATAPAIATSVVPVADPAAPAPVSPPLTADIVPPPPGPVQAVLPVDPQALPTPMPATAVAAPAAVPVASAPIAMPLPTPTPAAVLATPIATAAPVASPAAAAAVPSSQKIAATAPIVALAAPVSPTGVTIEPPQPATAAADAPALAADAPAPDAPAAMPTPPANRVQIDTRSAPIVALAPPAPLQGSAGAATTTSAIQAFGSAMRAGLAKDPRLDPTTDAAGTPSAGTAARTEQTLAVAATGDAQQAPLDLRREQWPHAMIDRIEALRDAADATSSKIRVVPDALGPVEMSVRKDGDTLHVHFTADQAATRAILTDAQPRLAAIAEQRGLKLGGSTVDGGSTGAGQQQQQAASRQPSAPLPSSPSVAAAPADDDDIRIA